LSDAFEAPLRLELRPSRSLRLWLIAVHAAVMLAVPLLPRWPGLAVLFAAGASAGVAWCRRRQATPQLLWRGDGRWEAAAGGAGGTLRLARRPFVHARLVVIPLCPVEGGRTRHVLILPDMLDAATFRRLRVRLRYGRTDAACEQCH